MTDTPTPAGWYEDPYGEGTWRWWNGTSWSTATRLDPRVAERSGTATATGGATATDGSDPTATMFSSDRHDRRRATIGVGALALVAVGIVVTAILFTGRPNDLAVDDAPGTDDEAPTQQDDDEDETGQGDAGTPSTAQEDGETEQGSESDGPDGSEDEEQEEGTLELDFDGACTVQVESEDVDDPRPWDFDECTGAPIGLPDGEERWIVVIASLSHEAYDEAAARDYAEDESFEGRLLWSSHYPSLNPDLWVVFEGPFPDEDEASAAADEIGGGSYARVLSDDDDDRYCIAEDGCVGGQGEDS